MSNSTAKGTEKRVLIVTRVFDTPVEQVWNAWTDPNHVMRWWGPDGFTSPSATIDFREGGTSLVCMRSPNGQDFYSTWTYQQIVPMRRIEYIHNLAGKDGKTVDPVTMGMPADFPQDVLNQIAFTALNDNQTEMTVTEYADISDYMFDLSKIGLEQCLDKMAASFAKS